VRRMSEQLELSQAELAEAVKTAQAATGLVELGRSNPTLHMIESIAEDPVAIERSEGEDLSDPETALACVEVFAIEVMPRT
jgi:transcriptional regulator with XRE-family HTH domain